jgi:hypothetical protein
VTWLGQLLGGAKEVHSLRREVRALQDELVSLRSQNERMRTGMRRCLTCDYKIQVENARR